MNPSEDKSSQLTDSYTKARATTVVAAGLLLLLKTSLLDLTKPIPFFHLSLPNATLANLILTIITVYGIVRLFIGWVQSDWNRRQRFSSRLDLLLTLAVALVSIFWNFLKNIDFHLLSQISPFTAIALLVFGFLTGILFDSWIFIIPFIRGKAEATKLALPRIPVVGRAMFRFLPYWIVGILIVFALSRSFIEPIATYWIWFILIPAILGVLTSLIDLLKPYRRLPNGSTISRKEFIARMRQNFAWHDNQYQINGWDSPVKQKNNILYSACESGILHVVQKLVAMNQPVDIVVANGWTPLMISVANRHKDVAQFLLEKGANPNVANTAGASALSFSALYGDRGLTKLLLQYGASPNIQGVPIVRPPLTAAVMGGHKDIVEILLKAGAALNTLDETKKTALEVAEELQKGEIAALLRNRQKTDNQTNKQLKNKD